VKTTDGDGRADLVFTVFAEKAQHPPRRSPSIAAAQCPNGTETIYLKDTNAMTKRT